MASTFFFRDLHTIDLAVKHLLPFIAGRSRIKIWDAGCAIGPEPYTLAIVLAENMNPFAFRNVTIDATDIDEQDQYGKVVTGGCYPEEELKRIPPGMFEKYFEKADGNGNCRIVEQIRSRVRFTKHNLLQLQPLGEEYSMILCKNVLLHFQQAERVEVIKMFHRSLSMGGLFATEQTQKLPDELSKVFEQVAVDAQLFRKVA